MHVIKSVIPPVISLSSYWANVYNLFIDGGVPVV